MKGLLRRPGVQAVLGWVLATYLKLVLRTVRWRHINVDCVEPVLAGESGALALFWHGRIPLCLSVAPQWWRKGTRALISPSADGEFIAQALARAGFPAIPATSSSIIIGDGTIFPCLIIAASSLPVCVSAVTSSLSSFCCERYVPPHFCAISAHAASAPDAALPNTSTTGPSVTVVGPLLAGAVVVDGTDAGGGGAAGPAFAG